MAGGAVSISAAHAFDEGLDAAVNAVPDALAAVPTGGPVSAARPVSPGVAHATTYAASAGAAQAGSALMRRSLEDSASLLLLAGIRASDATVALNPPAACRPTADLDAGNTPAIDPAHTQPAPDQALGVNACGPGGRRNCSALPSGIEIAEDADPISPSPVSSEAAAQGTAELHAAVSSMPACSLRPSPAQLQLCPDGGAHCEVRLLLSLRMVMLNRGMQPSG